jgi:1-acyl-sn-glycerol-3-phosphate acyltransferase
MLIRLVALGVWLSSGLVITALGLLLLLPVPSLRRRWRGFQFRLLSGGSARLIGMSVRTEGAPPSMPCLIVANHLSYLDIIAFSTVTPLRFVAKREVRGWPLIGALSTLFGSLYIHREQKRDTLRVLDELNDALADGDGVLVFAESTSSDGAGVLPFRPALLEWAARKEYPVHAASITYRVAAHEPAVENAVCWWGDAPFGAHFLGLLRIARVDAMIHFSPNPITDGDRKRLAERLHALVSSTFTPTYTAL